MIKRDAETPMPRLGLCVLQQRVHGCMRLRVNARIPCTHIAWHHTYINCKPESVARLPGLHNAQIGREATAPTKTCSTSASHQQQLAMRGFGSAQLGHDRMQTVNTPALPSIPAKPLPVCATSDAAGASKWRPIRTGNILGTNLCTQGATAQHAIEVATLVIHVIVCVDPTVHG